MESPLMNPSEVADYLGVPLGTVRRWRWRGEGPRAFRLGRHVKYRRAEVDRWLVERERAGGAEGLT